MIAPMSRLTPIPWDPMCTGTVLPSGPLHRGPHRLRITLVPK